MDVNRNATDQVSTAEQPTGTSAEAVLLQPHASHLQSQQQQQQQREQESKYGRPGQPQKQQQQQQCGEAGRQANWLLGVEPQDVRFPVNIAQVAFTANYLAALTADRRKIYINRRCPGVRGNCKRRAIDFPVGDRRPTSIVSFEHRDDVLCVVFRSRIEFHCLATVARVGAYETPSAEVVAAGAKDGRSPLGVLWCASNASASAAASFASETAFTVWTDRTESPQRALVLEQSAVVGRPERFLCFHWTSAETVLFVSKQALLPCAFASHQQHQHQTPAGARQQPLPPLVFCAYDTTGRRPVHRLCRRSVHSPRQFCLSPNGRLLLLSGGSRHQLLEAESLRQLVTIPRRGCGLLVGPPAASLSSTSTAPPIAVTNAGDFVLLLNADPASVALEIHRRGWSGPPARFELSSLLATPADGGGGVGGGGGGGRFAEFDDARLFPVGELGVLAVFEQHHHHHQHEQQQQQQQQQRSPADKLQARNAACGDAFEAGRRASCWPSKLQQQPQPQSQPQPQLSQARCLAALMDLSGNVIMRAEWPRARVHQVTDDLLVYLRRLSTKPFSAAHACIFDFKAPVARRSCWAPAPAATPAAAATAATAASAPPTTSRSVATTAASLNLPTSEGQNP